MSLKGSTLGFTQNPGDKNSALAPISSMLPLNLLDRHGAQLLFLYNPSLFYEELLGTFDGKFDPMEKVVVVVDTGGCAKLRGGNVGCRIAFARAFRPGFVFFYTSE
ncbi:hypothetical protein SNK03_011115 [Fusarium graminearum]|uniref:hypothetical protein n=1 Tax=Gibberella zeae (strain ATCC MYA-4620 / CBS 123657 / FGSC 9075 / NRRL 31084 / PH-1) TaxID=229533 RepID=UPI00021F205C|nr:hypothetical protein FGSG_12697 [Fusarium graminearum PH-1]ESU11109.1 hypothetical protein FGSG_12697 [Fusarium graminearum PH-1]KAI6757631.1 hypothetical protein HG531_003456 [Fusarium graminearum]|eukprot:XP_011323685.1 hypothetical protein FGSG_12697 [Fusarium graminearum PH-1]